MLTFVKQKNPSYDFLPHSAGCYSFQLEADRLNLMKQGMLKPSSGWDWTGILNNDIYLPFSDTEIVRSVAKNYDEYTDRELVRTVFL